MDNRHGLIVDVETTRATGTAEREAALVMLKRRAPRAKSLGADKGYDTAAFVGACRGLGVTPHVAAKRHATDQVSLRIRKRIEAIFGWLKSVGDWRKTKFKGTAKIAGQNRLGAAAYNLVHMASLNGWWDARHV